MIFGSTLLVIGNGFDLQCGLESKYEDFFRWLRQDKVRASANLWAIHFLNSSLSGDGWIDVEDRLQKALNDDRTGSSPIEQWARSANSFYNGQGIYPKAKEARYIVKYIENTKTSFPFNFYWFLDELIEFERQFSEYLRDKVLNNTKYLPNVAKLMDLITDNEKVNVINFNFTNPFMPNSADEKWSGRIGTVTNVHGTYENDNIIFGVDTTQRLPRNAHIFSKTHRKMLQSKPDRALSWRVEAVKFYGHSLEKADYSYFQSIFDSYNLYGDNNSKVRPVVLQFYFTVYDENRRTERVRDATDKVYKLITAYGDTLDNKDKGKNLLHKLLLEGRIQIRFLDNIKS